MERWSPLKNEEAIYTQGIGDSFCGSEASQAGTQLQVMPAMWWHLMLRSRSALQKDLCNALHFLGNSYTKSSSCWKEWKGVWGITNKLKHTEVPALISTQCCIAWGGQPVRICMTSWFSVLLLLNVMCICARKWSVLYLWKVRRLVQMSGWHSPRVSAFVLWLVTAIWGANATRVGGKLIDDGNNPFKAF